MTSRALSAGFVQQVRRALAHLYDYSYLQNHPLAAAGIVSGAQDQVTRAQALRRVLLDCIAGLKPDRQDDAMAELARSYAILTFRYLDGLGIEEIAAKLGLSRRQAYREHDKGVKAVASLLWDRVRETGWVADVAFAGEPKAPDRAALAQAEVERLRNSLHPELLDIRQVLDGVLAVAAPLVQKKGVPLTLLAGEAPIPVYADRIMLRQAILNLISQALEVPGDGELTIRVIQEREDVLLDIVRKPEARRPHHTDARIEVSLPVAQRLIQAQGGTLSIHHDQIGWRAHACLRATHGPTLLVIDDNADLVSLFRRYLAGHEVILVEAADTSRIRHLAEDLHPQMVILDLMMPNQDGWEVLRLLKDSAALRGVPLVICSVLDEREMALASGASDYLPKPVSQVALLALLRRWMGTLRPIV
ncbi:MAG: response regulator [Anaerolineae bacterium]